MAKRDKRRRPKRPAVPSAAHAGLAPGAGSYTGRADHVVQPRVLDYDAEAARELVSPDLAALAACRDRRSVTWLDLDGVHDLDTVKQIAEVFQLHPLWLEDILNVSSRPKVELLGGKLLVVMQVLTVADEALASENVALVLGPGWVLSFQEKPGDVWHGVRARIRSTGDRIRARGADYLLHALMDAVVDHYLLAVRALEPELLALEDVVGPEDPDLPVRVAGIRAELAHIRGAVGPLREAVGRLRTEDQLIAPESLPFFRDLSDHLAQVADAVDDARERATSAMELHLALQNQRLNDAMRVLTLVSTIFMPLSFLAGIYGMNFQHMPELAQPWGYPAVLGVMGVVALVMVGWFRRRGLM